MKENYKCTDFHCVTPKSFEEDFIKDLFFFKKKNKVIWFYFFLPLSFFFLFPPFFFFFPHFNAFLGDSNVICYFSRASRILISSPFT